MPLEAGAGPGFACGAAINALRAGESLDMRQRRVEGFEWGNDNDICGVVPASQQEVHVA